MMDVSHLRIVLLGKNLSENSRVGNFLLGRAVFDSEAPPDVVERVGGRLKDRHVMVINSPQLLQTNISDHQITQTVRECVNLSDPGPHVFILVLQYKDFTVEDMIRVKQVLKEFSDEAIKRTIMLTTDEEMHGAKGAPEKANELFQQLAECGGGHVQLDEQNKWLSEIFRRVENRTCEMYENTDGTSVHEQQSGSESSVKIEEEEKDSDVDDGCKSVTSKQKMNLVLCGSDGILKLSVSKLIRGKKENLFHLHHKKKYKDCVRRDVELHGCLISLVELPALSQLSEEKVMCQTLHCVSLCDPGVHTFLFIIPDAPLNNEDKTEIEKVQRIFSSRIENHLIILRVQGNNIASPSSATETSIQKFRDHNFVLEDSSQVPALLQELENMIKMNNGTCYTTFMYLQAQIELERNKHRAEIEELRRSMMKTQSTTGTTCIDVGVRFVLLGKTGVGKSATANTILGRKAFTSKLTSRSVTRECQKETSEFSRRQITVIDTPGLFDTGVDIVETRKEIVKCVSMAAPGPHVFLLVIQLGRFTQEEKDAVKMIQDTFGDKSRMYTMVLFTRGDELRGASVENFIEDDDSLRNIVQQCGKRYHVFNNETKDRKQVSELLEKIDRMVAVNGGSFYTNEMFQLVEKNIKEEQERIMKEKEEEIKRKEEELKTKYVAEIEQMKKENEIERQEMQNELRKSEEEFKKKEEEIKKETDENIRKELQRQLEEQQKLFEVMINRKEKASEKHIQHLKIYLEEKHMKEKQNLLERIQWETREQAECEYHDKLEREVAKALQNAEEEHKAEKDRILQEAEVKYNADKSKVLQEAEVKYKAEKSKVLKDAEENFKAETAKILKDAEENFKAETAKILRKAEEKQGTEKAKALQVAGVKYEKEKAKALQEAAAKHETEKTKIVQDAEEKYKTEKAKALQEAEEKHKREKANDLQEAAAKHQTEMHEALRVAAVKQKAEMHNFLQEAADKHKTEMDKAADKHKTEMDKAAAKHNTEMVKTAARTLQEAEEQLPNSAKLCRDWDQYVPVIGGTAGAFIGAFHDYWNK